MTDREIKKKQIYEFVKDRTRQLVSLSNNDLEKILNIAYDDGKTWVNVTFYRANWLSGKEITWDKIITYTTELSEIEAVISKLEFTYVDIGNYKYTYLNVTIITNTLLNFKHL